MRVWRELPVPCSAVLASEKTGGFESSPPMEATAKIVQLRLCSMALEYNTQCILLAGVQSDSDYSVGG